MQAPDSFAYESFTRVGPRKKRKGRDKGRASATPSELLARVTQELAADGRWSLCCRETFQKALGDAHVEPRKVLCLGLGSPSSSRDARAQLALLSDLCACSNINASNVLVYDPVFTDADDELFQAVGMRRLDHVQGARYSLDCPTVLYMPHCELKLYEEVVRANWTLDGLSNTVFLANQFSTYVDNDVGSKLEKECPCLLRLARVAERRPVPASRAFPSAFNNLSVQFAARTTLLLQGAAFWDTPELHERRPMSPSIRALSEPKLYDTKTN